MEIHITTDVTPDEIARDFVQNPEDFMQFLDALANHADTAFIENITDYDLDDPHSVMQTLTRVSVAVTEQVADRMAGGTRVD